MTQPQVLGFSLLGVTLTTMVVVTVTAHHFKHTWLWAWMGPLTGICYYFARLMLDATTETSHLGILYTSLCFLFVFISVFLARDQVNRFLFACRFVVLRIFHRGTGG